jgi:hypothetical protein
LGFGAAFFFLAFPLAAGFPFVWLDLRDLDFLRFAFLIAIALTFLCPDSITVPLSRFVGPHGWKLPARAL